MRRAIEKLLRPLSLRIRQMVRRGVVHKVNDTTLMQEMQVSVLSDETISDTERFPNYGFTSNPQQGAEAVVVRLGGDSSHAIVICADDRRYRLNSLQSGEVALYSDEGDSVILKRGKIMEINTNTLVINATNKVSINSPLVETSADIQAVGDITDLRDINNSTVGNLRSQYNIHTHIGDNGGTTGITNHPTGGV